MITSRTKKQLVVFVIITLVGISYVGARYARLDRLVYNSSYTVHAHFAQSGGIFTGAEVTYRGFGVGQVSNMVLTRDGVDVVLSIDKSHDNIPADALALVGNKSAVGEQYVELQPRTDKAPYLKDGSSIAMANTAVPVSTTELLTNLDNLVNSVPRDQLRSVVTELGAAFHGVGPSLSQIIDTSTAFINTANQNFDVTTALIKDSNTVLKTQVDKASAIKAFSRDLELFTNTLAGHDASLRKLIDNGSATANQLRSFLEQNQVNLGRLIANLVTTGKVTIKHLDGIRQLLILYPYEVAGGYTVAAKGPNGGYDAHFGLILTQTPPVCHAGYHPDQVRTPQDTSDKPMDTTAKCTEPATQSVPRGAAHAPRAGTNYRPSVATYDHQSNAVTWSDQTTGPKAVDDGGQAQLFGKDAWKWMLLQPAMTTQQ
jgi:phospholipid/cholesterol/gamma-HCH transport system substrate-binding protein